MPAILPIPQVYKEASVQVEAAELDTFSRANLSPRTNTGGDLLGPRMQNPVSRIRGPLNPCRFLKRCAISFSRVGKREKTRARQGFYSISWDIWD